MTSKVQAGHLKKHFAALARLPTILPHPPPLLFFLNDHIAAQVIKVAHSSRNSPVPQGHVCTAHGYGAHSDIERAAPKSSFFPWSPPPMARDGEVRAAGSIIRAIWAM